MHDRKGWLLIVLLSAGTRFATAAALDELCPVEWRNVQFKQAVEELAGQFSLPVLFDTSVTPEIAQTPVRLFARHLTGRQALEWLARWAGVEAAFVDGSLLIARPERLPRIWHKEIAAPVSSQPAPKAPWLAIRDRLADIAWVDAPLSLVARDVSTRFGIDLIIQPEILKTEHLVNLQQTGVTLGKLCESLASQLEAGVDLVDGALWVRPRGDLATTQPGTGPAGSATRPAALRIPLASVGSSHVSLEALLACQIVIDPPAPDWLTFVKRLTAGAQIDVRLQVAAGAGPPDWVARGTVREILEAAKLLGRLDYQLEPSGAGNGPGLLIKAR
jgi:hypothetical protein